MDYTKLSLAEVRSALDDIARETHVTFGSFDSRQLNWRPDPTRWSVAQCFEHLLTANRQMLRAAADALNGGHPRTIWQRAPILPGLLGRMLIRSQAPGSTRKFVAPPASQPSASDIPGDIISRFIEQNRDGAGQVKALDERVAAQAIMTSPFVRVIAYSVLDGWRLIVAHDHRHIQQARRVTEATGFPRDRELRVTV